jgi:hypothetical protein
MGTGFSKAYTHPTSAYVPVLCVATPESRERERGGGLKTGGGVRLIKVSRVSPFLRTVSSVANNRGYAKGALLTAAFFSTVSHRCFTATLEGVYSSRLVDHDLHVLHCDSGRIVASLRLWKESTLPSQLANQDFYTASLRLWVEP